MQQSIQKRGLWPTIAKCPAASYKLLQSYVDMRRHYRAPTVIDDFDVMYGVETSIRLHPTDLSIQNPNWINSVGYWPTPTDLIRETIAGLPVKHQDFGFVDFGSGKGRVLLIASEFPFREILGIEFSSELHALAEKNIRQYANPAQTCRHIRAVCEDFTRFPLPHEPSVFFAYNPASLDVMTALAQNIAASLSDAPREIWLIYVTPVYRQVFESGPLNLLTVKSSLNYRVYSNRQAAAH